MHEQLPTFLSDKSPKRKPSYVEVQPRIMRPYSMRAVSNLASLTTIGYRNEGVKPLAIVALMDKLATGEIIKSRLEPKTKPGEFRELWIPDDKVYAHILEVLAYILGSFSTSKETVAFRKRLSPAKGLRMMIDEYVEGCEAKNVKKKKNRNNEEYIVGTAYKMDIKKYYDNIVYEQILGFLRKKFVQMLATVLSQEECYELANIVADLVCPGETLPQGFATSPSIANGIGVKIDIDIRNAIAGLLGDNVVSTGLRYSDDILLFSSHEYHGGVIPLVSHVLSRHGFVLHPNKTKIVRALNDQKGASIIRTIGTEIRNDGDGPLRFSVPGRYTREVAEAIKWLLKVDLSKPEAYEATTREKGGHLPRVIGALAHIADTLQWGMPYGQQLRKNQRLALPKELEELWNDLRNKMSAVLSPRSKQFFEFKMSKYAPKKTVKETRKKSPPRSIEDCISSVFRHKTGWELQFKSEGFEVYDQNGNIILNFDKLALHTGEFPQDHEKIEDFLLKLEDSLNEETKKLKEEFDDKKIRDLEALKEDPGLKNRFFTHYLEFIKWHLAVVLNIPNLNPNEMESLIDTSLISLDDDKKISRDNDVRVFPWGIEACFSNFKNEFSDFFNSAMDKIFYLPSWHQSKKTGKLDIPKIYQPERPGKRNAVGYFVYLSDFNLKTRSGFPVKK